MKVFFKVILLSVIQIVSFVLLVFLLSYLYSLFIGYETNSQRGVFFKLYFLVYSIIVLMVNIIFEYSKIQRKSLGGYLMMLGFVILLYFVFMDSVIFMPISSLLIFSVTIFIFFTSSLLNYFTAPIQLTTNE